MPYLAVRHDVQALVEENLIARARTAVYYLLGHRAEGLVPLGGLDGVVASLAVEAIHPTLRKAALDVVVPATAVDVVVARVGVGVERVRIEGAAPQGEVV